MRPTSLLRRMAAILYDALLVFALLMLATVPFVALNEGEVLGPERKPPFQATLALVIFVFYTGFWSLWGRTLGMQTWGLRLETADGTAPGFGQASLRFFAAMLSWLPFGLGFLWQLWDKDRLTWHDRISGTRLVHYPRNK